VKAMFSLEPKWWVIENPTGLLREQKYMRPLKRFLKPTCRTESRGRAARTSGARTGHASAGGEFDHSSAMRGAACARVRECDDFSMTSPWCRKNRPVCRKIGRKPLPSISL